MADIYQAFKWLIEGFDVSYRNGEMILFISDDLLYYKNKEQTKREAVLENQQPHLFTGQWFKDNFELSKEEKCSKCGQVIEK